MIHSLYLNPSCLVSFLNQNYLVECAIVHSMTFKLWDITKILLFYIGFYPKITHSKGQIHFILT